MTRNEYEKWVESISGELIRNNKIFGTNYQISFSPQIAVDVLITYEKKACVILRSKEHKWALPGGRVEIGETFEQAAVREVLEEVNIKLTENCLTLLGTQSAPDRDPRGLHICSIVYQANVDTPVTPCTTPEAEQTFFADKYWFSKSDPQDWFVRDHYDLIAKFFNDNTQS